MTAPACPDCGALVLYVAGLWLDAKPLPAGSGGYSVTTDGNGRPVGVTSVAGGLFAALEGAGQVHARHVCGAGGGS